MAIDSKQKRMSTLNLVEPWRGGQVDAPEVGFTQGNRQASIFEYSGILAGGAVGGGGGGDTDISVGRLTYVSGTHVSVGVM